MPIPVRLPPGALYEIRNPNNFYSAMRDDIKLLFSNKRYVSMTTLIVCCMDALAGYPGKADKRKFVSFVSTHFRDLDAELGALFPGKAGALTFYE